MIYLENFIIKLIQYQFNNLIHVLNIMYTFIYMY